MKCNKGHWGSCPRCGCGLRNIGSGYRVELICPNHGTNWRAKRRRRK